MPHQAILHLQGNLAAQEQKRSNHRHRLQKAYSIVLSNRKSSPLQVPFYSNSSSASLPLSNKSSRKRKGFSINRSNMVGVAAQDIGSFTVGDWIAAVTRCQYPTAGSSDEPQPQTGLETPPLCSDLFLQFDIGFGYRVYICCSFRNRVKEPAQTC